MKKNFQILLLAIVFCFSNCKFEEENIFDESAAVRMERAKKEYTELLCSSPNGWIMEYFPTDDKVGYTFLMKFFESGMVEILAKSELTQNRLEKDTCLFEMIAISGPVLSLNSYSEHNTFHKLVTPEDISGTKENEQGIGYGGDYEFIVMKTEENQISLRGLKRKVNIPLTRFPENRNREDYFDLLEEMNTAIFNTSVPQLYLSVNDSLFTLTGGTKHIFKIVPDGGDPITDGVDIPFIVTDYGIRLVKPFKMNDLSVQTFKLSEDKNSLISTDKDVNAKIQGPEVVKFFNDNADNGGRWSLVPGEDTMSEQVQNIYDRVLTAFSSKKVTLGQISYLYSGRYDTYSVSITYNRTASGILFFNKEATGEGVNYTFMNNFDSNGRTFYNNYDGVQDLIENVMSGTFRIETFKSELTPSTVKFINTANSNIWFVVTM